MQRDSQLRQTWPPELLQDLDDLWTKTAPCCPPAGSVWPSKAYGDQDVQPLTLVTSTPVDRKTTKAAPKQRRVEEPSGPSQPGQRSLVLCFDGTGNKFQGTAADSNSMLSLLRASLVRLVNSSSVVKIYSLLDRQDANQSGIGTYIESRSLSHESWIGKVKSSYAKAKDMAVGTSFGDHVMAGYKFLMRYYNPGDAVYFFGFSRGAYTARFLAQMLDYVGLLSTGNEEMLHFAWKTFARWQMRTEHTGKEKLAKRDQFEFMQRFRETFSRPTERIKFIGLFDCVNSVPQFESAWMRRTKFPYTAKTSARAVRHAVAIDERRAKFRQDLVSEQTMSVEGHEGLLVEVLSWHHSKSAQEAAPERPTVRPALQQPARHQSKYRPKHTRSEPQPAPAGETAIDSATAAHDRRFESHLVSGKPNGGSAEGEQDILEVWFAGQHGDIGGGWTLGPGEYRPASDLPLMWMLREARKAGMPFDEDKLQASGLLFDDSAWPVERPVTRSGDRELPQFYSGRSNGPKMCSEEDMYRLETATKLHDSLAFGGGLSRKSVLSWQLMEYLPMRRMDLQPDGSWKPISWPLPRGETRDMPDNALVHSSVLHRMQQDSSYRPGNLILGGGGRVVRRAPKEAGIGHWRVAVGSGRLTEAVVRVKPTCVSSSKRG
ncbi:hypothetical protein LTR02_005090 [Friedmanniomyces endolithicus]|nr:hypothetical protein LTR94_006605 [Friedmanniomyces endolithicus]KAK0795139.1 hypothetical protein LTR59_007534 [Friedmanniomyces endolithicus]KAK0802017.1 hypothetical protein LTR38_006592 [Friedmanniomyces endolithicus]KAK0820744.1 hypothetical protein LTR75_001330 [Friedmanniomyces endolithicus]KAK0846550.1 hypothetical protein LTR03_006826 [Friedmanniomyces endolithicus]